MKTFAKLFFCFCMILSSFTFVKSQQCTGNKAAVAVVSFIPKDGKKSSRSTKGSTKRTVKRKTIIDYNYYANVNNVSLSRTEIVLECSSSDLTKKGSCSEDNQSVEVSTEASDPENDVLVYNYIVSGGAIIGTGAKVVWNLSNVTAGNYTITATVDDTSGVCGKTITKQVKIIDCADCK